MERQRISVVICTKDRHEDLANALASLAQQTRRPDEVIIVDASQQAAPPTLQQQLRHFQQSRYLRSEPGLPAQRNQGIDESQGDLILFFDDDVILDRDYVARIAEVFELDTAHRYGGGMGQILLRPRRGRWFQWLLAQIFMLGSVRGSGRFKLSGFASLPHGTTELKDVETLSGCCMSFRREVLMKHRLDENLGGYAYMEDADISYRVSREYALFYQPEARLRHLSSPTAREHMRARAEMLVCNHHYLFRKNFPQTLSARLAHFWSIFGLAVRMISYRSLEGLRGIADGSRAVLTGSYRPRRE